MKRNDDVVSASEIASWAWCPASWRLNTLGHEPENRAAMRGGEERHAETAAFEVRSRSTISLGWRLLALALFLALLVLILGRG